jgi:hypothetical protein
MHSIMHCVFLKSLCARSFLVDVGANPVFRALVSSARAGQHLYEVVFEKDGFFLIFRFFFDFSIVSKKARDFYFHIFFVPTVLHGVVRTIVVIFFYIPFFFVQLFLISTPFPSFHITFGTFHISLTTKRH